MKINPSDKSQTGSVTTPIKRQSNANAETPFSNILGQVAKTAETATKSVLQPVQPIHRSNMIFSSDAAPQSTEQMLDALTRYQQLLANPAKNLREMEPVVEQMKKEISVLSPLTEQLLEGDQMKQIATDALVLASKEIARFENGDYIDK